MKIGLRVFYKCGGSLSIRNIEPLIDAFSYNLLLKCRKGEWKMNNKLQKSINNINHLKYYLTKETRESFDIILNEIKNQPKFMSEGHSNCKCCKLEYWNCDDGLSIATTRKKDDAIKWDVEIPLSEFNNLRKAMKLIEENNENT